MTRPSFYDSHTPDPAPTIRVVPPDALAAAGQDPIDVTEKVFERTLAADGWTREDDAEHTGSTRKPRKAPRKTAGRPAHADDDEAAGELETGHSEDDLEHAGT